MVMLSVWWWLPLAVAVAAGVALWRGMRALSAEAAALRSSITRLAALRPLVAEIRAENASVVAPIRSLRDLGSR